MVVVFPGNPLSILDGIFVAIKDDIDCYPHPSKGKFGCLSERVKYFCTSFPAYVSLSIN